MCDRSIRATVPADWVTTDRCERAATGSGAMDCVNGQTNRAGFAPLLRRRVVQRRVAGTQGGAWYERRATSPGPQAGTLAQHLAPTGRCHPAGPTYSGKVIVSTSARLRRISDELLGDPMGDVLRVRRREPQDDVPEAGGDGLGDGASGGVGPLVADGEMDRAGDRLGVAPDLGAIPVKQRAALDAVVEVATGDVPHVGVLRDDAQQRGRAAADEHRRARPLNGLGIAERAFEPEVLAVDVERLGRGPEAPDDRARLGQGTDGVLLIVERQPVGLVLAPRQRMTRPRRGADPEVEPTTGDDVDGRRHLREHRRRPEAVAGHEHAYTQAPGLRRKRGKQRPALISRAEGITADRQEVVEQPRVLDFRNRFGLQPDPPDLAVVDLHRGGHDPEARHQRLRDAACNAVVLVFHMLSATSIVSPGGTISSIRSSTSSDRWTPSAAR